MQEKSKLKGVADLIARFKELKQEIAAFEQRSGTFLIDYLFPDSEFDNLAIREAAELADVNE